MGHEGRGCGPIPVRVTWHCHWVSPGKAPASGWWPSPRAVPFTATTRVEQGCVRTRVGSPRSPLTRGREQQRAVLAVEVLHGGDPGVPGVPVVEVIQLLPLLPVPETLEEREGLLSGERSRKPQGGPPPPLLGWPHGPTAAASPGTCTQTACEHGCRALARGRPEARDPAPGHRGARHVCPHPQPPTGGRGPWPQ